MNTILIGFMGSGKSSVGKRLSELSGRKWIDMDDLVYEKTKTRNMKEVFALGGEPLLRETEILIAKEYALKPNLIVSTGGGVVLNQSILDDFKKGGAKVFFLHVEFENIAKRLEGDNSRPLFAQGKTLYDARLPLYFAYADVVINVVDESPEEVARKIHGL